MKYKAINLNDGKEIFPLGTANAKALYREVRKECGLSKRPNKSEKAKDMNVIENLGVLEITNEEQSYKFKIKCVGEKEMPNNGMVNVGEVMEQAIGIKAKCSVCNTIDTGLVEHSELGLVHQKCLEILDASKKVRMHNQVEKQHERRKHNRYRELNLKFANAVDEATANIEMWIEPSIYEGTEDQPVCAYCGQEVEDNPHKVIAGDDGLHAHINCITKNCMESPDFQALLFWEDLGFKLPKFQEDLIISALASGNVAAAYKVADRQVPDVRHLDVKFKEVKKDPKKVSDFAIPVAAYDRKAIDENHRSIRNRCRDLMNLPSTSDLKEQVETREDTVKTESVQGKVVSVDIEITDDDFMIEM